MLATRQVLGNMSRGRALAGAASGIRRMATVSDNPLDKKVSFKTTWSCLVYSATCAVVSWFVGVQLHSW